MGPTVRTQEMAPAMTPRTFKVQDTQPVPPLQLLPTNEQEDVQVVHSTPSERIGQLYTPSAVGMSPRLMASTGLPSGREPINPGTVVLGASARATSGATTVPKTGGRTEVVLAGGPTTQGSAKPSKASHWGEYGTAEEKQSPSLPIEWFDAPGSDDPSVWEAASPTAPLGGQSRYLSAGQWEWRPCSVVGYEPEARLFTIRWKGRDGDGSGSGEKRVRRLNLCLDGDDLAAFEQRGAEARQLRKRAEEAMRLSSYVDGAPAGEMPTMLKDQVGWAS